MDKSLSSKDTSIHEFMLTDLCRCFTADLSELISILLGDIGHCVVTLVSREGANFGNTLHECMLLGKDCFAFGRAS